jgi:hypothetical protein
MSVLSKTQLTTNINAELADNNAGAISAYDVRHNMIDIVDSINQVVASGDFDATTPFTGANVRAKITNNAYGAFIAESGVIFPYGANGGRQLEAYPGPGNVLHNSLTGLTTGDPHTQYMPLAGSRVMTDNLGLGNNWINSSGNSQVASSDDRGLRFDYAGANLENIRVGNKSRVVFDTDSSTMSTAKGVAKAWINFDASSPTPAINSYFNIHSLEKLETGKFEITFTSGTFGDNYYIAVGSSNGRSTATSQEDFSINKVGVTVRSGNDASSLRKLTFCILDDGEQYVDAKINELVVYGRGPSEGSGIHPSVIV